MRYKVSHQFRYIKHIGKTFMMHHAFINRQKRFQPQVQETQAHPMSCSPLLSVTPSSNCLHVFIAGSAKYCGDAAQPFSCQLLIKVLFLQVARSQSTHRLPSLWGVIFLGAGCRMNECRYIIQKVVDSYLQGWNADYVNVLLTCANLNNRSSPQIPHCEQPTNPALPAYRRMKLCLNAQLCFRAHHIVWHKERDYWGVLLFTCFQPVTFNRGYAVYVFRLPDFVCDCTREIVKECYLENMTLVVIIASNIGSPGTLIIAK